MAGSTSKSRRNRYRKKRKALKDQYPEGTLCHYCKIPLLRKTITLDHKNPIILGGSSSVQNIVPACTVCNSLKGDMAYADFISQRETLLAEVLDVKDWKRFFSLDERYEGSVINLVDGIESHTVLFNSTQKQLRISLSTMESESHILGLFFRFLADYGLPKKSLKATIEVGSGFITIYVSRKLVLKITDSAIKVVHDGKIIGSEPW